MRKWIRLTARLSPTVLLGAVALVSRQHAAKGTVGAGRPAVPVVVELFSSEGCSSCPPADALLKRLDQAQPVSGALVVPLEFHVDYWNYLGWKDPFSQHEFSARQEDYARVVREHGVFTPELIVEGRDVSVGSDEASATTAISAAASRPHATVGVKLDHDEVSITVERAPVPPGETADVWLAVTEVGLATEVRDGENRGRRLEHGPVVRRLVQVGAVKDGAFTGHRSVPTEAGWNRQNLRWVAFVQAASSRRILGAAEFKAR
jgi:hypothetical protein